jgi:hypothetical protein
MTDATPMLVGSNTKMFTAAVVLQLVDEGLSGSPKITGFAWGVVYDTKATGSDQNIWIQLDITSRHEMWGKPNPKGTGPNVFVPGPPLLVVQ